MVKILNAVFGIGIAVIVFIVALLGIRTFYPEPQYSNYCNDSYYNYPTIPAMSFTDCPQNITVQECNNIVTAKNINSTDYKLIDEANMKCNTALQTATKSYNKIFFIIASSLGLIAIIIAFFLLNIMSLSSGIAFAGIVLIIVAFTVGWNDSNDILKFVVSLIIAIVVVILALKINEKFSKELKEKTSTTKKK